jgi:uncharacterized protein (TIGR03032 family)
VRLRTEFVRLPLSFDAERLREEVAALPDEAWRPHPQGHPGNFGLPLVARGGNPADDGVAGRMLPTPPLERCEYMLQVLASLETVIGRTRLMRLEGRSNATLHVDVNYYWADRVRVHIPIVTSPAIEFLCGERSMHMAAGDAWIFDATRPHDVRNSTGDARIHLVADTVGSKAFWNLVADGWHPFTPAGGSATAPRRHVAWVPSVRPELATERVNFPVVMTPWEMATHVATLRDLLGEAAAGHAFAAALDDLVADWRAAWATHGNGEEGWPAFRELLARAAERLAPHRELLLTNGYPAVELARQRVLLPALNPELVADRPAAERPRAGRVTAGERAGRPDRRFSRPIVIVAPPRSGTSVLFETLARSPDVWTIGGESHRLIEGIEVLHPAAHGWDSNRLTEVDATTAVAQELRDRFIARLRDRADRPPPAGAEGLRLLEKTPKNTLRVPFLRAVFPDAVFVYLWREPRETLASMIEAWRSRRFVTYRDLPGWSGPPWSLLLTPEWRRLDGLPLAEVVAQQWAMATRTLLADLERLDSSTWCAVDYTAFLEDPDREAARVCEFAGVAWDELPSRRLPVAVNALTPPHPDKWRAHEEALAPILPGLEELAARGREWIARPPASRSRPADRPAAALRSSSTSSFGELLDRVGGSLVASTYQSGRVVTLRRSARTLNTHFRELPEPMGIARDGDRLAIGTGSSIVEYRNVPAVAEKLPTELGSHDACFVPRRTHVTGDIRVHDVAYAAGELWAVATRFSCLVTFDEDHSFVPRWRPPFVGALAPDDRCHLNGLAMVDDRPGFVTALGASDEPGGWRAHKASGGVLIDIDSSEVAIARLSMPHSPRWHRDRLWLLESGRGSLAVADLENGTVETVAELPGFTRGLALAGPFAFVGLSQVRESLTFGGIPLTARLAERECGVWVVDIETGTTIAFLRFEGEVREIFDVELLNGLRFPEIAEPESEAARLSYVVPDEALRAGLDRG